MMNERIKELIKQATEHDYTTWDSYNQKELVYYKFNQEKFAKLIVRECVDICYNHPARMPSNNWQGITVPLDIAQRLEEHFGVEK